MRKRTVKKASMGLFRAMASPTGLACSGLALICGSIASNALLLQAGRHPSPLFSTRSEAEAEPPAVQGDLIVEAVQHSLRSAGFYDGPVDGVTGPRTRAAILEFERQAGLPVVGVPSAELIGAAESWAAQRPGPAVRREAAAAEIPSADARVIAVQAALARAAYGPLTADGEFGQQTRDAISRFQLDQGMTITGEIDDVLIRRLEALGALDGT